MPRKALPPRLRELLCACHEGTETPIVRYGRDHYQVGIEPGLTIYVQPERGCRFRMLRILAQEGAYILHPDVMAAALTIAGYTVVPPGEDSCAGDFWPD